MMSQLGQTRQSVSASYFFPHSLSLSVFLFLTFSLYFFFLFISSLLCLSQILNCSGKNSEHLLLAASKWASLCYQKQLLAFCSWLCCFVLASLQQVHLITISFSSFFPCLCLEKLKFLLVLCFLFEGLFSFPYDTFFFLVYYYFNYGFNTLFPL